MCNEKRNVDETFLICQERDEMMKFKVKNLLAKIHCIRVKKDKIEMHNEMVEIFVNNKIALKKMKIFLLFLSFCTLFYDVSCGCN